MTYKVSSGTLNLCSIDQSVESTTDADVDLLSFADKTVCACVSFAFVYDTVSLAAG